CGRPVDAVGINDKSVFLAWPKGNAWATARVAPTRFSKSQTRPGRSPGRVFIEQMALFFCFYRFFTESSLKIH
ncbi:MAG: hypothetical protein J6I89_06755, partial [Oscillospiraceae bacterium]|nr:hypothetical protein [Oscillospiraceae bacterium]